MKIQRCRAGSVANLSIVEKYYVHTVTLIHAIELNSKFDKTYKILLKSLIKI
jgi:hypothetical protein